MPPNVSIPLALAIFVLAVSLSFRRLGARCAVASCLLGGTLFLPVFESSSVHVPLLTAKTEFVSAVALVGSLIYDRERWRQLKLTPLDWVVAVLSLLPIATSLSNDLGVYDGLYTGLSSSMTWGAPYLLGRLYLGEVGSISEYATSWIKGALLYVPLCLWEIRMSPQLHARVFGFDPGGWLTSLRYGGYRPRVFMSHGLMLAMFMVIAALLAFWMWRTQPQRRLWGVALGWWCILLLTTTLLIKSVGALLLLIAGIIVLELTRRLRTSVLVIVLMATPAAYCTARIAGWSGQSLVALSVEHLDAQRGESLQFRLENEDLLIRKALQRPWIGWGGWARSHVFDEEGRDITITDGLWIIKFGMKGLVGLISLGIMLALPTAAFLRRFPARYWGDPRLAPAAALTIACLLWAIDEISNGMLTPLFPAACGGIMSLALRARQTRGRIAAAPSARRAVPQHGA